MSFFGDLYNKLKNKAQQASNFVQQYPSPASFVQRQIPRAREVFQPVQRFVQQNPTPASFVNRTFVQPRFTQPLQRYFQPTTQVRVRDVAREFPSVVNRTIGPKTFTKEGAFTKHIIQPSVRNAVSLLESPAAKYGILGAPGQIINRFASKDTFTPESKTEKYLLGNEPVKPAHKSWLAEKTGSPTLGMLAVGGQTLLDITGAGKGKGVAEDVIKSIAKSKNIEEISKLLKVSGKIDEKIIPKIAQKLVNVTDASKVKSAISEASKVFPKVKQVVPPLSSEGKVGGGIKKISDDEAKQLLSLTYINADKSGDVLKVELMLSKEQKTKFAPVLNSLKKQFGVLKSEPYPSNLPKSKEVIVQKNILDNLYQKKIELENHLKLIKKEGYLRVNLPKKTYEGVPELGLPSTVEKAKTINLGETGTVQGELANINRDIAYRENLVKQFGGQISPSPSVGGEVKTLKTELPPSTPTKIQVKKELSTPQNSNVSLPPTLPPTTPPVNPPIPLNEDPVNKIINALKEAKPLNKEQQAIYSAERSKRLGAVVGIGKNAKGEGGYFQQLGALKGQMPKVSFESVRPKLAQPDIDSLFNKVNDANIGEWEKINVKAGLTKLLSKEGGSIPTQGELKLMNDVFGSDFTKAILDKRSTWQKMLQGGQEVLNLPRAMMASFDLSAPLRQGVFLVGKPKQWVPAFISMFKQAGSEGGFKAVQSEIMARPTYQLMRESRLALTDMSSNMAAREEMFMSNLGEKIPVLKYGMKASNRAYTGFLNKLRADTFDDLVKKATSLGLDTKQVAPDIAKFVNSATGRGDLGALNRAATTLNGVFFSPRLMASRINMLNPAYYVGLNPFVRKEAIKSLLTFGALAGTTLGLAKYGGAGVGTDPRSADFGKIKVGNTRYDVLGGFQQYIVLASRLISGKMVSSTTGKEISLTEGYKPTTRKDIVINFLQSKENPILSFATGLLEGTDTMGQKFNLSPEIVNRFIPMVAQDINDLYTENKDFVKSIGMALPGQFGVGVQTYGTQIPTTGKTPTGKSNIQWTNPPDIGQKIINKFTGGQVSNIPQDQWSALQISHQQDLQMKADVSNAVAKVTKQIKNGQTVTGVTTLPDGRGLYVTDEGIKYAKSPQQAQIEINKDKFQQSGKSFQIIDNMVYRQSKDGTASTPIPKIQYDYELNTAKLTSLKANNNFKDYMTLANQQLDNIDKQLQDPTLDELEKQKLLNEGNTLATAMAKYQSYGGFTKPKKGKSGKAKKAKIKAAITKLKAFKVPKFKVPNTSYKLPRAKVGKVKTITAQELSRGR